jgi:hypothetical protein
MIQEETNLTSLQHVNNNNNNNSVLFRALIVLFYALFLADFCDYL